MKLLLLLTTDSNLKHFSLAADEDHVVPFFQEIIEIAPDINIIGSPWIPPGLDENQWRSERRKPNDGGL